jgi:hypothetical protein
MRTLTRPIPDRATPADDRAPKTPLGVGGWARGRSLTASTRMVTYGLFGAVALGLVLAILAFARPAPRPAPVKIPEPTVAAEGFAQLFVATWLVAQPGDSLAPFYPGRMDFGSRTPLPSAALPPALKVLRTASIEASELNPGYWSITVGAQVQAGDGVPDNRFYRVAVLRTRIGAYVAAALPSEVAGPLGAKAPNLAVGSGDHPEANDPVAVSVSQFLGALLAGKGDLTRYMAPGSTVKAISPVPFTAVEVTDIASRKLGGDANHIEVDAAAVAVDAGGRLASLTYPLELTKSEGRWEVVRILSGPSLASQQPDLSPATTVPTPTTLPLPSTAPSSSTPSTTTGQQTTTTTIRRN